jgi:protein associated with RNAse G/E
MMPPSMSAVPVVSPDGYRDPGGTSRRRPARYRGRVDEVDVVLRKYDGRPHRRVTARRLGEDRFGTWLATPAGTTVHYAYPVPRTGVTSDDSVRLIPRDGWWIAMFTAAPEDEEVYCDIALPPAWTSPGEVTVVDLDLDVIRVRSDGRVVLDDEDEFAGNVALFGYPDEAVRGATTAATELVRALTERTEPFGTHYRTWLNGTAPDGPPLDDPPPNDPPPNDPPLDDLPLDDPVG